MGSVAAERELLFGLLALQNGLIDQSELFAALEAWKLDKSRGLAEHLVGRGDLDVDDRLAVEALAARHLKKHGNDVEKSLAGIPAGRSTREGLAAIGEDGVTASLMYLGATVAGEETSYDRTDIHAIGTATSDGLRFRILRPHAQGGLGAVFVALDGELNREVALKQILDRHADDPDSRQRFLVEAEVTGGLEHPGIVPVYGLGTYGDGRPYYAMRFIKGDSLKDAIDGFHAEVRTDSDPGRWSLELRKLLKRFTDVCNAIDYAHSRGVLHRDIKPGNIIVGRHGETLVVDWGLAKATGKADPSGAERMLVPASASGSSATLPGSALGTPAYMSPEQAEGNLEALGPRSDVYSLGATLYCLLTGRSPITGSEIGAILRAVRHGEFVPPCQVDDSIDRALEAVCLKAMALQPDDRYGSCRALAEDVERWMADEPVSAWREPFSRRAGRWARRNRTAVTAAAAALLAGMIGLAAVSGVQAQANGRLRAANTEVKQANNQLAAEKTRVQERYDLAMRAIKTFHTGVSEDFLLKEDKFRNLRDRLLKSASDFYGKLGALLNDSSDRASRRAMLQANYELAELTSKVGRKEDALAMHRQTLIEREALAAQTGEDVSARVEVVRSLIAVGRVQEEIGKTALALDAYEQARAAVRGRDGGAITEKTAQDALAACQLRIGWVLKSLGKPAESMAALGKARDLWTELAAKNPSNEEYQVDRAMTAAALGVLLSETGKTAEAISHHESARAIYEKLAAADPAATQYEDGLARSHQSLGLLFSNTGKPAEALKSYGLAEATFRKLAEANPAVSEFQSALAIVQGNTGLLLWRTGKLADALAALETARATYQKLVEANPAVTRFQRSLASSYHNIAAAMALTGKPDAALASHESARAIRKVLAEANPAVTDFQSELANSHNEIGILLMETGKPADAIRAIDQSRAIFQKLAEANPAVTDFQSSLAGAEHDLGWLLAQTGKPAEALAAYQKSRAINQKLADANPAVTQFQDRLAYNHYAIGLALAATGKRADALAAYESARAIRQKLADANPSVPQLQAALAGVQLDIGWLQALSGKTADALVAYETARAIFKKLADANPSVTQFQAQLAASDQGVGGVLLETGKLAEALKAHDESLVIRQRLAQANPTVLEFQRNVGRSLISIGEVQSAMGHFADAIATFEKAVVIHERLTTASQTITNFQSGLATSISGLGRAQRLAGRSADAVASLRRAIGLRDRVAALPGEGHYEAALDHALLATLATVPGSGLPTALGQTEADSAIDALRRAVASGFCDAFRAMRG